MILNRMIEMILVILIILTPLPWGSTGLWAFSSMELAILLILLLWAMGQFKEQRVQPCPLSRVTLILLLLFLGFVLLQMVHLPGRMVHLLSPKTYQLRSQLQIGSGPLEKLSLSFFPLATKIEFFKWAALAGLFIFFLHWNIPKGEFEMIGRLAVVILVMGAFESFYGLFRFFGVENHAIQMEGLERIYSVMGTFVNHNHFAGYLLMVIPFSIAFLYSRESRILNESGTIRRYSSLDGKGLLIGFSIMGMILGLLFSASRMGIVSLLLSSSVIMVLFRGGPGEQTLSRKSAWILGLALLWGASIGLDVVIRRFFGAGEDFAIRWNIWGNTLDIVKTFPLFGSGLGTFAQVFPMYRSFHIRGIATHAENDYLQLASEVGLVGLALLLALFLILFVKAVKGIRSLSLRDPRRYIGIGSLVGILALMFHSLVERNLQVPCNAFLYTLLWGTALKVSSRDARRQTIGDHA